MNTNCLVDGKPVPYRAALDRANTLLAQRDTSRQPASIGPTPPQRPEHGYYAIALQNALLGWGRK